MARSAPLSLCVVRTYSLPALHLFDSPLTRDVSSLVGWQFGSAGGIDWSAQGFTPATFFAAGTTAEFRLEDNAVTGGTSFRTDLAMRTHTAKHSLQRMIVSLTRTQLRNSTR